MIEISGKPGVEDTRLKIVAATRELYAAKGSRGTTTREVADRAGVNEATLFRHFRTKQQLIAAMLDYYATVTGFPEMLATLGALPTLEEQLSRIALSVVEAIRRKEDLIRVSMAEEVVSPDAGACAWRAPLEAQVLLAAFFDDKVREGELRGQGEWLSKIFLSLFFSFVMARRIWANVDQHVERSVEDIVELFLNGTRAK